MIQKSNVKSEEKQEGGSLLQLEAIVEESHDAIIGETLEGIITSWNGGATKMFGYSREEAIGKSVSFLLPEELKNEVSTLLNKIKSGEVIADYDSVRICKDNSRIDVGLSCSPVHTKDGVIIGASIVERDITKRKWYVAHIQRMARIYEALSTCNNAVVFSKNEDELFEKVCGAVVQLGGMSMAWVGMLDEVNKQIKPVYSFGVGTECLNDIRILVNADDPFGRGPTSTSIRENHPVWTQDFKNDPATAPWHERAKNFNWCSAASLPLLRNGVPIGSLTLYSDVINAFDDTAKKLLTEVAMDISFAISNFAKRSDLKKSEESLLQTRLIVEDSHDAIIGKTLDGIITSWNGGATKMFGYSPDEVIGKPMINLFPLELKDELPRLLEKVRRGEVIADYDSVWLRKDGIRADVEFSISPVHKDGVITGASLVGRDITTRKKGEQHVKELSDVRNKFISIISHQLRTPLTAINWNLESILDGDFGKLEDTTRKFLQVTHKASVEITHRVYDLLTAMDIEEGRVIFEKGEMALDSITAAVINEMIKRCELKGISCEYVIPKTDLPVIEGDSEKIRIVVTKLMENALIYTKENGKINVKLEVSDDVIRFEVKDTGVGIPSSEQHYIFNRFFRASNASVMQPDSFGLGLFVSKSFIEQHGGRIGFESKEGKGSTFWFEIPIKSINR